MKIKNKESLLTILTFTALTVALYFVGYWMIYRLGKATPLMLSVGAAALITCYIRNIKVSDLGWHWGEWKYQKLSYMIPLSIIAISYFIIWFFDFGGFYNTEFIAEQKQGYNLSEWNDASIILFHFLVTATITFLIALPSVLGEEIAWRGLLVPELSKCMSFTSVAFVSGIMWAVWHWPLIFFGLYGNSETPLVYQLVVFTMYIVGLGIIMTYLRYKTNSLWTAVLFHMSLNVFMQKFFTPLTTMNEQSVWFVDEFGAVIAITVAIFAFYYLKKGKSEFG